MVTLAVKIAKLIKKNGALMIALTMIALLSSFTLVGKEDKGSKLDDTYIWFQTISSSNCNPNLNQYPDLTGTSKPAAFSEENNPTGCAGGNTCCARGYLPEDVVYNSSLHRWEPAGNADFVEIGRT